LLGCSTELIRVISCINQLRIVPSSPTSIHTSSTTDHQTTRLTLLIRSQLLDLQLEIHIHPSIPAGAISRSRTTLTAKLYRIVALVYLYQTAPPEVIPNTGAKAYIDQGFAVLDQMDVCSSPCPLFIMACAVTEDCDGIKIMSAIEEGARQRRVGNYAIIENRVRVLYYPA
jgi:hypothetical protein